MYNIVISRNEDKNIICIIENGILVEKYEEKVGKRLEGNIYVGKVENILKKMEVAFIDIGESKNAFIHLNESYETEKILKQGDPILVQVKRDSEKTKGARVSSKNINLAGKYVAFLPNNDFVTISQKLENIAEKERLINIVKKALPKDTGAVIRTSAEKKDERTIIEDLNNLLKKWNDVQKNKNGTFPKLILKNDSLIKKIFTYLINEEINLVIVDNNEIYKEVKLILEDYKKINNVKIKMTENSIQDAGIEDKIEKLKSRKIWLKCGGFITIDNTEALTAIDVNSGKYNGNKDLETTSYLVNLEATEEIAKQLKLRDLGGIIIIDYIDMEKKENQEKIQKRMIEVLKKDRAKTQVEGFTKLNLMELTRKRIGYEE